MYELRQEMQAVPEKKLHSIANAMNQSARAAIRDEMIEELRARGLNYSDFEIITHHPYYSGPGVALRTVQHPMPPAVYDVVMEVFAMFGGPPVDGIRCAVVLANEAGGWKPIHPAMAESDQGLARKCAFIQQEISSLKSDISRWMHDSKQSADYICWPAVARRNFNCLCIVVSMVDPRLPNPNFGPPNFSPLRDFIRSLPEYRRYVG